MTARKAYTLADLGTAYGTAETSGVNETVATLGTPPEVAAGEAEEIVIMPNPSGIFQPVAGTGGSASAVTRIAASATSVQLLAAKSSRLACTFQNNSTEDLYLKLGATAVLTSGSESYTVVIAAGTFRSVRGYGGRVDGIWAAADATGEVLITEVS